MQILETVKLALNGNCNLLLCLSDLHSLRFLLIFLLLFLELFKVKTILELILDEVFGLGKVADELFSFFLFKFCLSCFLDHTCKLELLLLLGQL